MTLDLSVFRKIVRPTRTVALADAQEWEPTEEPVLLHGAGPDAVGAFARVAPLVGWGSALALEGVPSKSTDVIDDVERIAREHHFWHWYRGTSMPGFTVDARSWVKHMMTGDTYATHLPILLEAVSRTTGPVLELGAGRGSTTALHDLCAASERLLVTVDADPEWIERFAHLASETHRFESLPDPAATPWLDEEWSVVFVDHAPGETRCKAIERARSKAEWILAHDSEELGYGMEEVLSTFTWRRDHRRQRPWTTVVSTTREPW